MRRQLRVVSNETGLEARKRCVEFACSLKVSNTCSMSPPPPLDVIAGGA